MKYLKHLWTSSFIDIKIDKRWLYLLLAILGLLKLKQYIWMQGAIYGYEAAKQEHLDSLKDDADTHDVGHFDHSKDNPSI